ncbi:hypothetical protein LCGC14_1646090 [marine sediment metagenome]|uniref:Uncharacterized protein n=1 Tax=marine sediment metagenome TaxID=412755 RepID=A0A0F9HYX4_9ZZZZ
MPAFMWSFLYSKIVDQYSVTDDGETIMIETKAEAQRYVFQQTLKSPFFWIYSIFAAAMIFSGACSVNAFGLGDWYFSL